MLVVTLAIASIVATATSTDVEKRSTFYDGIVSQQCMQCICEQESLGCLPLGCHFDVNSIGCGYFQIHEDYYNECGRPGIDWHTCSVDLECSSHCVQAYMNRYIGYSGCEHTCESYARIHNGGPNGCTNPATFSYWHKIQNHGCT